MAVYITREELDKILLSKIEPIETSLNFNGQEECYYRRLKSASHFRFKKLLKESVISKYWLVYFVIG